MGIEKLAAFALTVVMAAAFLGNLDRLNRWTHQATAKILWDSRSTWGSPMFFKEDADLAQKKPRK